MRFSSGPLGSLFFHARSPRVSRAFARASVLRLVVMLAGCDRTLPEGDPVVLGAGPSEETQRTSTASLDGASAPGSPDAGALEDVAVPTLSCPAGMREVGGDYCTAVVHRCIRGGRGIDGKKSDLADPYHCDEYQVGYAPCLGRTERKHFCIDDYEFPNEKGAIPRVMVSWYEAKRLCEERGARLCGDDEWTLACEGPERRPYAYGWKRDPSACNIDRPWRKPDDGALASKVEERIEEEVERLSQRVPSGSMPDCVSPYGVHDLGGNVDEWTVNVTLHGKPYASMFKGGHWCKGARNRCRPTTESHDETTAYYAEGFRCCRDASP
jgi:formylglycine-generating enzyme